MIRSSSAPDAPASPSTPGASRLTSALGASGAAARTGQMAVAVLAALLLLFIVLPLVALFLRTTPGNLLSGLRQPAAVSALVLSLETTAITLALALALGTPAAFLPASVCWTAWSTCRSSCRPRWRAWRCSWPLAARDCSGRR
jgi:hypothetical protein